MPSKPAKPASVTGPSCTAHERPDASTPVITKRPPVAESGICDPSGNETKVRADSSDMQGTLAAQTLGDGGPRGAPFRSRHQRVHVQQTLLFVVVDVQACGSGLFSQ